MCIYSTSYIADLPNISVYFKIKCETFLTIGSY